MANRSRRGLGGPAPWSAMSKDNRELFHASVAHRTGAHSVSPHSSVRHLATREVDSVRAWASDGANAVRTDTQSETVVLLALTDRVSLQACAEPPICNSHVCRPCRSANVGLVGPVLERLDRIGDSSALSVELLARSRAVPDRTRALRASSEAGSSVCMDGAPRVHPSTRPTHE